MTRWVTYTDMGQGSGAMVNPDDHGGEDSDNFKYLVEHGAIVSVNDPAASVVMGKSEESAADMTAEARARELEQLRARVAELETAQKSQTAKADTQEVASGSAGTSGKPSGTGGGGGGAASAPPTSPGGAEAGSASGGSSTKSG
jgi:hypothetical protein